MGGHYKHRIKRSKTDKISKKEKNKSIDMNNSLHEPYIVESEKSDKSKEKFINHDSQSSSNYMKSLKDDSNKNSSRSKSNNQDERKNHIIKRKDSDEKLEFLSQVAFLPISSNALQSDQINKEHLAFSDKKSLDYKNNQTDYKDTDFIKREYKNTIEMNMEYMKEMSSNPSRHVS